MEKPLDQRVAVITGGGRGIGAAIAKGYARAGARIVVCDLSEDTVAATAQAIRDEGGEAAHKVCDVTDYSSMEDVMAYANEQFGGVDIIVGCAGIDALNMPVEQSDPKRWAKVIEVNLIGVYHTARAAIPYLRDSTAGKIIFIGSGVGHRGIPNTSAYGASKAGLRLLVTALAQEVAADGICVNELVPGPVATGILDLDNPTPVQAQLMKVEWVKQPEDVLPIAIFMASQPATGPTAQTYSLNRREL